MTAELRHLLDKLKAEREGFQQLVISSNGNAMAIYRWQPMHFASLEAMEKWAYSVQPPETTEGARHD